jgi:hypothetical protein
MHQLIDSTSLETLKILSLDVEFLTGSHPSVWKKSPNYMEMKTKVDALKVVNDIGERGFALMNSINGFLTKDEIELQNILQVVERHRNKHIDSNKSTLMAL